MNSFAITSISPVIKIVIVLDYSYSNSDMVQPLIDNNNNNELL